MAREGHSRAPDGPRRSRCDKGKYAKRVISLFFLLSYLPFSLPVILAGIGAQYAGLVPTTIGFASLLVLISAWVLGKSRSLASDTPTGA
ncbi:hypothetical protein [Halomonas smyrnensis]|uniref:hypothetical protein n=1 Tax=Halomonas smyrnensis TaxID=720605 RepID=UPI00037766AF|nr:hypothetical protein [Halomonas smyrnensis]